MKVLSLRLPDELHERIKRLAQEETRSINYEIVDLLLFQVDYREKFRANEKARRDKLKKACAPSMPEGEVPVKNVPQQKEPDNEEKINLKEWTKLIWVDANKSKECPSRAGFTTWARNTEPVPSEQEIEEAWEYLKELLK